MSALTVPGTWLDRAVERFDGRGAPLAVGRTVLALAQLAVLVFNRDADLFVATLDHPGGVRCDGVRAGALWCLTGGEPRVARTVATAALVAAASGYRPRWTCLPHWYVTAGMAMAMPMANGGDKIAQIATMLLIPLCLGDDRRWHWTRPDHLPAPVWRGVGLASLWALRVQVCVIYLYAALSKLRDPLWRQGSAMSVVFADPYFGLAHEVRDLAAPVLRWYWPVALLSWSVIAVQVVIAVAVLCGPRTRVVALVLGLLLHGGIGALMNLPLFALVVIGMLIVACAPPGGWRVVTGALWRASSSSRSTA